MVLAVVMLVLLVLVVVLVLMVGVFEMVVMMIMMMINLRVLVLTKHPRTVAPKVCPADPKGSTMSSQRIHGYISVTDNLKFAYFFKLKNNVFKKTQSRNFNNWQYVYFVRLLAYLTTKHCTHEASDSRFNQFRIVQCIVTYAVGMYQYLSNIGSEI